MSSVHNNGAKRCRGAAEEEQIGINDKLRKVERGRQGCLNERDYDEQRSRSEEGNKGGCKASG